MHKPRKQWRYAKHRVISELNISPHSTCLTRISMWFKPFSEFIFLIAIVTLLGCSIRSTETANTAPSSPKIAAPADLKRAMRAVEPFFSQMPEPKPMDWLANFKEPGQTFDEYINDDPTLPTDERKTIYVLPFGKLKPDERETVNHVAEFLNAFYGLPIKTLEHVELPRDLSPEVFRMRGYPKRRQVKTHYILQEIMKPRLPKDAAAMIALTNEDLYPDDSMSFVFGQASFDDRVGVWSLSRLKDKDAKLFLTRALKLAAHETGHMFSIRHCTKYECVMSGSNHIGETDRHPLDACPECMAKIAWLSKVPPAERYAKLEAVCRKFGLTDEAEQFAKKRAAVRF